ncbi:MAG: hypothetical protein J0M07_03825 [Anaerolineae bacterium]|nr:hypothetical protein [Anaerolineae bacterium]
MDNPWSFDVYSEDTGSGRSAASHYDTMSLDDLKMLPMHQLMDPTGCAVLLWGVWPSLPDVFGLVDAWNKNHEVAYGKRLPKRLQLTYKTCAFLWVKTNKHAAERKLPPEHERNYHVGLGYHTRANTEPCLLFTLGRVQRQAKDVRQLVVAPRLAHSAKPPLYDRIERLYPGPRLEVFARNLYPGWHSIGNELDGADIRQGFSIVTQSRDGLGMQRIYHPKGVQNAGEGALSVLHPSGEGQLISLF